MEQQATSLGDFSTSTPATSQGEDSCDWSSGLATMERLHILRLEDLRDLIALEAKNPKPIFFLCFFILLA